MKDTAAESAELKMALKHDEETPALRRNADEHPQEAAEAIEDVAAGLDTATPGSWVAKAIVRETR